jgi:hypothetical protein
MARVGSDEGGGVRPRGKGVIAKPIQLTVVPAEVPKR